MSSEDRSKVLVPPFDAALKVEVDLACNSIATIAGRERNKHYLNHGEMETVDRCISKTRTATADLLKRLEETRYSNRFLCRQVETKTAALTNKRWEVLELEGKVQKLETEKETAETAFATKSDTKGNAREPTLTHEADRLKVTAAALKSTKQEVVELKTQLVAQSEKLDAKNDAIAQLQQDYDQAQKAAKRESDVSKDLKTAYKGKDGEVKVLNSAISQKNAELKAKKDIIGLRDTDLRTYKSRSNLRGHELAQLKKKMQTQEAHTAEIQGTLESERKEVKALTDKLVWRCNETKQLKTDIKHKDADFNLMKGELAELRKAKEARGVNEMDYDAASELKDKEGRSLEVKLASMETEIKELQDSMQQKDGEIQLMKTKAHARDGELAELKQAHQTQTAETAKTQVALEAKDTEINALRENATSKTKELEGLKKAQAAQAAETATIKAVLEAKDIEVAALENDKQNKTNELEELKQAMESQVAETEMLWNRVAQLQTESKKRLRSD